MRRRPARRATDELGRAWGVSPRLDRPACGTEGFLGRRADVPCSRRAGNGRAADPSIGVGRRRRADAGPMNLPATVVREVPRQPCATRHEEENRSPSGVRLLTSEAI